MEFQQLDLHDPDLTGITRQLVDSAFGQFFKGPQWEWKYHDAHSIQHSLAFLAIDNGEVVAALHYQRTTMQLGGTPVPVLVGGDLIVRPDHRGKGLTTPLTKYARNTMPDDWRGGATFMFTRPRLGEHYRGFLGYSRVPAIAEQLTRIRIWAKRLERVGTDERFDQVRERARSAPTSSVEWRMDGAPPIWTVIDGGTLSMSESHDTRADAIVSGRIVAIQRLAKDSGRWRALAGSVQRRELKASIRPSSVYALSRSIGVHVDAVRAML